MSTEHYVVGKVRRAHGLRGELVIETRTDAPDAIFAAGRRVFAGTREGALSPDGQELHVIRSSPFKGGLIVAFEGISDRVSADAWRDRYLLVSESEVTPPAEDQLFIHELVGMRVVRAAGGDDIGQVVQVFELPQGLLLDVQGSAGRSVLLPFDHRTVTEVDAERRVIRVDPVEGLLD